MPRSSSLMPMVLFLLVAAVLVLPGMGATRLWQDEGQTAVVAQNIVASGLPRASDGVNTVSLFPDQRDIRDGLYIWQPWLPNYLAAASLFALGSSSFAARLPFALCFLLLVWVAYRFYERWQGDRQVVVWTLALMVGSVPMLLHARQCRYYVLGALLSVLAVDAYLRVCRGDGRGAVTRLVAYATLLFNTFPPGALLLGVALGADALWLGRRPAVWRRLAWAAGAIVLLNLPMLIFMRFWDRQFGVQPGYTDLRIFGLYLLRYLLSVNLFFFPALVGLAALAVRWRSVVGGSLLRDPLTRVVSIMVVVQVVGFALISDFPFTRYLIAAAPFVFFLAARSVVALSSGRVWVAGALVASMVGTNLLALPMHAVLLPSGLAKAGWNTAGVDSRFLRAGDVGGSFARGEIGTLLRTPPRSPLLRYVSSYFRPAAGPIDRLVEHLEHHARPGDRVYTGYGDLALMFHTSLAIRTARDDVREPEFFVPRHFNPIHPRRLAQQRVDRSAYAATGLDIGDFQWNNRPDPVYHRFRDGDTEPPGELKVFRRLDPDASR